MAMTKKDFEKLSEFFKKQFATCKEFKAKTASMENSHSKYGWECRYVQCELDITACANMLKATYTNFKYDKFLKAISPDLIEYDERREGTVKELLDFLK